MQHIFVQVSCERYTQSLLKIGKGVRVTIFSPVTQDEVHDDVWKLLYFKETINRALRIGNNSDIFKSRLYRVTCTTLRVI